MKINFDATSVRGGDVEQLQRTIEACREMPAIAAIPGLINLCGLLLRELRVNEKLHVNLSSQFQLMSDIGYEGVLTQVAWWRVCVLSYNSEHVVPIESEVDLELRSVSTELLKRLPKEGGVCFAVTSENAGALADYTCMLLDRLIHQRAAS